ncbi:two-component sensor histidine kinase KinC [Bacillus carboniphilus]|uniref:histidine kinase n=1 Tax=Bacillus carboniphilus TaxID=86663 RepID=A0ABP3GDT2_9BACI
MFKRYKGRIISTITFICAVGIWNIIFYGYNQYSFNLLLDLSYTLVIAVVVWWLASYYDKSKLLLDNLSDSEMNYKKLLESSLHVFDNINQVVYQTDENGNLTLLNPYWKSMTGFEVDQSLNQSILNYIYPEDQESIIEKFLNMIKNHQDVFKEEVRIRKKDGGFVWVEINTKFSYNQDSQLISTLGTITDISEWKHSEQELIQLNHDLAIQSDKLNVVAQMSAAIVHEVRNPLTAISGFLQLITEEKNFNKEYVDVIFSEIKRVETVLSEMLILSRPQKVTLKKVDYSKTLDHVLKLMESEANMRNIELVAESLASPVFIYGQENQIKQVLINIIKNAIEAMQHKGKKIQIHHAVCQEHLSIYIKDEGLGMPQEILKKIGQPFYTTKERGTGLGLTVCFNIIEQHKGKIHISSQIGVGTTFEIMLPTYSNQTLQQDSEKLVNTK